MHRKPLHLMFDLRLFCIMGTDPMCTVYGRFSDNIGQDSERPCCYIDCYALITELSISV